MEREGRGREGGMEGGGTAGKGEAKGTDVEEFWGAEGHGAVLGGLVLLEERGGAGGDGDAGGESGAKVHENRGYACVGGKS